MAALVLITLVSDDVVNVVPLDFDEDMATDADRVLPEASTTFQVTCAALVHLRRSVPRMVLDVHVAELHGMRGASESTLLGGFPPGLALLGALDDRARELAKVEADMAALAAASWVLAGSGSLGALLENAGAEVDELAPLLKWPVQRALSVMRGRRALARADAETVASAYSLRVSDLLAANPELPPALVRQVDAPRSRARLDRLSSLHGLDEAQVRRLYAGETFALAARQTGEEVEPDWRQRLDMVLDAAVAAAEPTERETGPRR